MRQLKLVVVTALALCALSVAFVSSASAFLPKNLPEKARTWTAESVGVTSLLTVGGNSLTCEKAKGEGNEAAAEPKGEFHINFEKCKESIFGTACTGTNDTSGNILVLGEWHLVIDALGTGESLKSAVHFGFNEFAFKCDGGIVTIKVRGDLICLHLNPTVKSKTHEFHCNESTAGSGKPDDTKYWLNEVQKTAKFETSFNGGAFEESAVVGLGKVVTAEEISADQ